MLVSVRSAVRRLKKSRIAPLYAIIIIIIQSIVASGKENSNAQRTSLPGTNLRYNIDNEVDKISGYNSQKKNITSVKPLTWKTGEENLIEAHSFIQNQPPLKESM